MSNNRTFFKNAVQGQMSLRDIFSDMTRKHTPEESSRVLIAGTALTTPDESEMLAGWQKPFLFARFFVICCVCLVLTLVLAEFSLSGIDALLVGFAMMVPMTMLVLAWEMNVPRTISLMEVLKIVAVGGILSLIFTMLLQAAGIEIQDAAWAPVVEEPAKLAVVYILLKRKNRKYILEGVLLGMAVGTGFAIIETMNYILNSTRAGMLLSLAHLVLGWAEQGGIEAALVQLLTLVENQASLLSSVMLQDGAMDGIQTAILRSANGIVGHGVYAALYSGGLMMAKGSEEVSLKHLLHIDFLKFFAASFLIHFLNNSGMMGIFPWIIPGYVNSWSLVKAALGIFFLLKLFKTGVNQVVQTTIAHNSGRVTIAVNRDVAEVKLGGGAAAGAGRIEFLAGPLAGQSFSVGAGQSLTIGRSPSCSIPVVGASNVSGKHCSVSVNGSMILVTDLGSTNGTFLGKQRLAPQQPTPVPDGGMVYLGNQNCVIRVSIR